MAESYAERTAGIWLPFVFYVIGGAYMLGFWALFDRAAYHLILLGGVSLIVAGALYSVSRWAFWIGLFTFPIFFAVFLLALLTSVNFVGLYPNIPTAAFNASLIVYLVFLTFSLLLLIDRRNHLKSDRILDLLKSPTRSSPKTEKTSSE